MKLMKKRLIPTLLLFTLLISLLAGCGSKTTSDTIDSSTSSTSKTDTSISDSSKTSGDFKNSLKGITLKVGTSGTYAPFSYFNEDGTTLEGYDVEMLKALQEVLGFTIADDTLSNMDYGPLTTSVSSGQLDVVAAALCATDERKETMNFSDTYYDAGIVVIVPKENSKITSVDDLASGDYKVAIQTGTIAYEYAASNFPEECIQTFDSQALAYKAVEGGQADATIYDAPGTSYSIKTGEVNLQIVGDEFYNGQAPYAIAFSFDICKKYPELVNQFNEAIAYLKENGTLDDLKGKWCQ